jgi:hypothetical protein
VLCVIAGTLYIAAIVLGFIHLKRERGSKPAPPPPPVTVHQENKQTFNPQFNPTINVGTSDTRAMTIEQERAQQEELVLDYLRRQHELRPSMTHLLGSIASGVGMPPAETDQTLQRLYAKGLVFRSTINAPGDFIWWYRNLV